MRKLSKVFLLLYLLNIFSCKTYHPVPEYPQIQGMEERDNFIFIPGSNKKGFIFYPGGLVSPYAYIQVLKPLVNAGYSVVIPKMPFNLAIFAYKRGLDVPLFFAALGIESWGIGGHSLGGSMAAQLVYENPEVFDYLVLLASYPADKKSLKDWIRPVLSIWANRDGLVTGESIENSKLHLPDHTQFYEISGGNHSGFGSYGHQENDLKALISEKEQHRLINKAFLDFLDFVYEVF